MEKKGFEILIKIFALILPFYTVFYWRLQENVSALFIKSLWRFTIAGFILYGTGILLYALCK